MKKIIAKFKTKRLLVVLFLIIIISFLLGILFPAVLSDVNKKLVQSSLDNFFLSISKGRLNYVGALISSLSNNIIIDLFIWLLGISIIGIPIIIFVLIFRSFLLGFSFSSLLMSYGFKGIILSLIYIIPAAINLFFSLILCYYAISFSIMLFNYLFRKKDYSRRVIVTRYIKIFLVCSLCFVVSSLIEVFVIPNILKFFI